MGTSRTFKRQRPWSQSIEPTNDVDATSALKLSQVNPDPQYQRQFVVAILREGGVCEPYEYTINK